VAWPRSSPAVQAVPPRGHEALPQGRALPDRQVRRRAPLVPAGRARPRAHQAERVPAAAAREAEGAPLLRRAREAVPHYYEVASRQQGITGENLLRLLEMPARQRRLPARLRASRRRRASSCATALPGQRPPVDIPSTRCAPTTTSRSRPAARRRADRPRRDRPHRVGGPWLQADHDNLTGKVLRKPERERDRHAGAGAAHRRAVLQVVDPSSSATRRRPPRNTRPVLRLPDAQDHPRAVNENRGRS
jgi:small subunit ribosomal protein S4